MIKGWITEKKFKNIMTPNERPQNEKNNEMMHVMLNGKGVEFILLKKEANGPNEMKASRCTLGTTGPLAANAKQKQYESCEETFDNKNRLAEHYKYCTKV